MTYTSSNQTNNQSAPAILSSGAMIGGRFEVQQVIRRDFAGIVYSARDGQSQRDVECLIINILKEDTQQLLELRAHIHDVKQIKLKSFASTYGIGKQGVDGYLVRQKIEGRPLTDHLNHRSQSHRPFKQRGLCSLLIEMIQALEALKSQEVNVSEHGLLRPNIIMIQNQSKPRVRLTDMGLGSLRTYLVKNKESDPWTRGCIPELRGEIAPMNPDLYAIGALLFQMTQLRPFTKGWLRELSVAPTFSQLPDLIEACTAADPLITMQDLKSELKYAAQSQVESGGLTKDLSQLQERLQKIIHYETSNDQESKNNQELNSSSSEPEQTVEGSSEPELEQDDAINKMPPTVEIETDSVNQVLEQEILAAEPSISVVFNQLSSEQEALAEHAEEPIFLTPVPTSAYQPQSVSNYDSISKLPQRESKPLQAPADFSPVTDSLHPEHSNESEPLVQFEQEESSPNLNTGELAVDMSAMNEMLTEFNQEPEQVTDNNRSSMDQVHENFDVTDRDHSLDSHIETLHGIDLEELDEERAQFQESMSRGAEQLALNVPKIPTPQLAQAVPPPQNSLPSANFYKAEDNSGISALLAASPEPSLPYDGDLSGQRWIVVRAGIDYGPYTLDELSHQLFREEIGLDTEICDIETDQRAALGEFSSLDHVLNEWAKERLERKKQRAIQEQKAKLRRRVTLIASLSLLATLSFAGISYGPQIRAAMLPTPANVQLESWVPEVPKMEALEYLKESKAKLREKARIKRAAKARLETLKDAKAMAKEAREAAAASTVDFNRRGGKVARFSRKNFDRALSTRSSRLMKCIEAEAARSPNKEVLKVTMTVQRTGRFLNARLANGSGPGVKCVFRAIQGLKMPPFSGGDKTITLPYKVK